VNLDENIGFLVVIAAILLAWWCSWHRLNRLYLACRRKREEQFWTIARMATEIDRLRSKLREKRRLDDDGDWWKDQS
jgi:hypothetical protein